MNMATLRGLGSGTVGKQILSELAHAKTDHLLEAWIPQVWGRQMGEVGKNIVLHECGPGFFHKFITENLRIRSAVSSGRFDRLFSLGDTSLPSCHLPHLLMVQQAYLAYPRDKWDFPMPASFRVKIGLLEQYFRLGLQTVSMVTVQTQAMRQHLASRWKFPAERIAVVPSSVNVLDTPSIRRSASGRKPYVCFVASASPHKNHVVLAEMMAVLQGKWRDVTCWLTVSPDSVPLLVQRAKRLRVLDRFVFLNTVSLDRALEMMAHAVALVMPSKLESFGISYYEAMAVGCPVVAADRDFAREACGDAGLYADADTGEAFASYVSNLLESDAYRAQVAARVKRRFAETYRSWSAIAVDYWDLLEHLG